MRKTETKEEALKLLQETRSEFLYQCKKIAISHALKNGSVTIDDVRDKIELPEGIDGRVFGAVFNNKDFVKVGYTETKRKTSHKRPIAVFELDEDVKNLWNLMNAFPKK